MMTVFLSGSRALSRINDAIRERLDNMIEKEMNIIVGDANGADKAMQSHLAKRGYKNVIVFHVNGYVRNNVGDWKTESVKADSKLAGRDLYAQKDKEMARLADIGLVLWDGKSAGSVHNIFELLKHGKKVVVYFGPEKQFYTISSMDDAQILLNKCDSQTIQAIRSKLGIAKSIRELETGKQESLRLA